MSAALPAYGIDDDRGQPLEALGAFLRRRLDGRYPVDPFGGDPQLQDLLLPVLRLAVRVTVEHPERVPQTGPALLVSNRSLGLGEPAALTVAVREASGRRLRVVGVPDAPFVGDVLRKLGGIGAYAGDVAALLRAGHLGAVPLGPTWLRPGVGTPPLGLLVAALGSPVIPVAVRATGPFGLPIRAWRVVFGEPLPRDEAVSPYDPADPLGGADLAEAARSAVRDLLDAGR